MLEQPSPRGELDQTLGRRSIVLSQSDELNIRGNGTEDTPQRTRTQSPLSELPVPKPKANWWVYILRCRDGTLYAGVTTDPARRLAQHNAGTASKYTRARRPVAMIYRERAKSHGDALRRELAIKKLSRAAKDTLVAKHRTKRKSK